MTFVTVHICSFIEKRLRTNRTCLYAQLQDIARESLEKIKEEFNTLPAHSFVVSRTALILLMMNSSANHENKYIIQSYI